MLPSGIYDTFVVLSISRSLTLVIPWTVAHEAPVSVGFPRPEFWSGMPFPPPGDLLDLGIELGSPALQADSLLSESLGKPGEGNGYPLHYSCLENSMDRGSWWATVPGVAQSWT